MDIYILLFIVIGWGISRACVLHTQTRTAQDQINACKHDLKQRKSSKQVSPSD
jgi:hypothetical protein